MLLTNVDGRITFMNPAAERLTGWTGAQAGGREAEDVPRLEPIATRANGQPAVLSYQRDNRASFGDDRAMNGSPAMAMSGGERATCSTRSTTT